MTATADLCDRHPDSVAVARPLFRDFGRTTEFHGPVTTVVAPEDNSLVAQALAEPGEGRVLVVDGGGSLRCALVGDRLAALAAANGWAGIVVNGCIRDSAQVQEIDLGIKALATSPARSIKRGAGSRDVVVSFAGISVAPGHYLYADADGIVVAGRKLE